MKKFAIVARPDEVSTGLEAKTSEILLQHGWLRNQENPEIVIVIGGDGTFIYAVHQYLEQLDEVCFFGIHTGTLGFYTDYRDTDFDEFIGTLLNHNGEIQIYPMLRAVVGDQRFYALNEIRIENAARTQVLNVAINGNDFEVFRGTGMSVCTQLGSTAYNRSLGGAVIQEGLDLIELVEISGIHHSKYRSMDAPFVLKSDSVISFKSDCFDGALLGVDADVYRLDGASEVVMQICQKRKIRVLRGRHVSYFERLKSLF